MSLSKWLSSANRLSQQLNWKKQVIRDKLGNDPYCRFESLEEIQIAQELGLKIDVNQASVDDWLRLPGISIHQARTLVELVGMGLQLLSIEDIASAIAVPVQRLKPLEPVLEFCYYDAESLLSPQKINVNTASLGQLEQIPYLNSELIIQILENRQEHGLYHNLADFQRRLNLNSELISQLMYYISF